MGFLQFTDLSCMGFLQFLDHAMGFILSRNR